MHPAIERIFGKGHEAHPKLEDGTALAYAEECLALCEREGFTFAAEGWRETIEALKTETVQNP